MYYTTKERLDIGNKVYTHFMTKEEASREYQISEYEVIKCVKEYLKSIGVPYIPEVINSKELFRDYSTLSKEELIKELMLKDIEIERTKKGYTVKGGGKTKVYSILKDQNTK